MNKTTKVYLVLLPILLLAVAGVALYSKFVLNADNVTNAKTGDCVRDAPEDKDEPFRLVACTDAGAKYKVLAVLGTGGGRCADVAGASTSTTTDDSNIVCMGAKDVDPAKAINVAKEGDCVDLDPAEPQRADCASKEADHKVLKRVENVLSFQSDGACHNVPGADKSYSWDWKGSSDISKKVDGMTVDVVLCLGPLPAH
ncbi:LppU/SCO3897 family protein [Dactylosporangium salmoneum]|uniref:Secreted protein n=1 Tax=Dactylosporangium salmoneum TaxID=53361 RepID=A0ABP5UJH1_9ACTN